MVIVGVKEGLKNESAVSLDNVQTVARERVGRQVGALSPARKAEVRRALLFALELEPGRESR